jgi:hypothetical protein
VPPTRRDPSGQGGSDPGIDNWVSASEIGAFEYCARAYWLQHVREIESTPAGESRLAEGTIRHEAYGLLVLWQRRLVRAALALLVVAALVALWRR